MAVYLSWRCGLWAAAESTSWMASPSVSRKWRGREARSSTLHGVSLSVRKCSPHGMTAKRTRSARNSSTNRSSMAWSMESTRPKRWPHFYQKKCFLPNSSLRTDHISPNTLFTQEDDIIDLTAKHLYIQHGSDSRPENVKQAVQDCITTSLLEAKSEAKLVQMVSSAHAQVSHSLYLRYMCKRKSSIIA